MNEPGKFSIIKPTLDTPFQIDFNWWQSHDQNWRVFLHSFLCDEHKAKFSSAGGETLIDFVDPETAEVHRVDGLQHILMTHCAKQAEFLTEHTSLVNAVFRYFLANSNTPASPRMLGAAISKDPVMILRTFSGMHVYQGIRPIR